MDVAVRNKAIADRYSSGENVKQIMADYPDVGMKEFYSALREHGVPKRGRGSHLKNLWKQAKETGELPETLQRAFSNKGINSVTTKRGRKTTVCNVAAPKATQAPTATQKTITQGMNVLAALIASNAVTKDDLQSMLDNLSQIEKLSEPAVVEPTQPVSARAKGKPRNQALYNEVIRYYKTGRFTQREISKLSGTSFSSVTRYIAQYRATL